MIAVADWPRPIRVSAQAGAVIAAGLVLGVVGWLAADVLGWLLLVALIGAPAMLLLVRVPALALAAVVVVVILLENDPEGFLPGSTAWYRYLPGLPSQPTDLLLVAAVVAVAGHQLRHHQPLVLPGRFTFPLFLLAAAVIAGVVTGWLGGGDRVVLLNAARVLLHLILVPLLTVQVLDRSSRLRGAVLAVAPLVAVKSIVGLAGWAAGEGRTAGESVLIYYAPAPNLLLMVFLLGVLGAWTARVRLPRWVPPVGVLALGTFALSYRRSFWISFALAAVVVLVVASGRRGRPAVLVLLAASALALWGVLSMGSGTEEVENPVIARIQSLSPDRIEATSDDRYRLDEQRNVITEIRRSPITGLGLGVPWSARHPLPLEFEGGRHYTHTTVLWFWLKLGLLGVVAYLALVVTSLRSAAAVWRRASDRLLRVSGLALGAALLGLAVAETTGAFTGIEPRMTVVIGFVFGWLAAAEQVATAQSEPLQPNVAARSSEAARSHE